MSEYQYYAFQAIDRPLSAADQQILRGLSTRAQITATSFTNSYEWGNFKGDPAKLMETWFDLHVYLANWGSRRLMIRWPAHLADRDRMNAFLREVDGAELRLAGQNLILDVAFDEMESEEWDDGSGWLAALAPLRADVLAGDLRLFYLLWLTAVEADVFEPDEPEPMPGLGPVTGTLEAFAGFFNINPSLVAAAAEQCAGPLLGTPVSPEAAQPVIAALSEREKTRFLMRLYVGDVHVKSELQKLVRHRPMAKTDVPAAALRTAGQLRARAAVILRGHQQAQAEAAAAARKRQEDEAERSRRARLDALGRRGERVWLEIEAEIERRNAAGYDKAASLILDLRVIAGEKGTAADFGRRLQAIRDRHARKERFIERLTQLK